MRRAGLTLAALLLAAAVAVPALGTAAPQQNDQQQLAAKGKKFCQKKRNKHKPRCRKRAKKVPRVRVADDYYAPTTVRIRRGGKVKFKWARSNLNPHNVTLKRGPKKLTRRQKRKLRSRTGSYGIKFNPKFKRRGTYKFYCTLHPGTMQMTVKVRK